MFHSVTESPLEMSALIQKESSEEEHRLVSASATPTRLGVLAENSSAHNLGHNSFYSVFSDSLWQWFSSITI